MTQTRTFLILAWLMVATLLWMEWGKERDAAAAPAPAIPTATQAIGTATPRIPVASVPGATPAVAPVAAAALPVVRLRNDVLALELNGRDVTRAELLRYKDGDVPPHPDEYGEMVARATKGWNVQLMFEPGRVICGNAGVLVTQVIRVKPGSGNVPFVIVDAAMNALARPALYDAGNDFEAVEPSGNRFTANIVGPVCETGDTFAMAREIDVVQAGDLALFRTCGAYGATMASAYNSRGPVPEVLVSGNRYAVVAERIVPATILDAEHVPDWLA